MPPSLTLHNAIACDMYVGGYSNALLKLRTPRSWCSAIRDMLTLNGFLSHLLPVALSKDRLLLNQPQLIELFA